MNANIKAQNEAVSILREIQRSLPFAEAKKLDESINWTLTGYSLANEINAKTREYKK